MASERVFWTSRPYSRATSIEFIDAQIMVDSVSSRRGSWTDLSKGWILSLVNYFAPPMEVEETPPLLERELTSLDSNFAIPAEDMTLENGVSYSAELSSEAVQPIPLPASANTHISSSPEEISPRSSARLGQFGGAVSSDVVSTSSTRYPTLTLGGAIGIRRPRSSNSQLMNNNLTLDQLNPTLAEALAAMKAKSGIVSKPSGNATFTNGSDSFSTRKESLPTRMSGPVTLESLAPTSSTSPDGNASTSGHIVSFNGQTTEVPEEIHCHLCNYPMKLCLRKTKYKGEIREYAAYRCLRKGCQTFRSVRKVIEPDYPYPRKRKNDDSYEMFDSSSPGTGASSGSIANDRGNEANDNGVSPNGTLIYVKQELSTKQMEKMLEFDFKFFNDKPAPMHTIPRLLFGRLNMSVAEMDELLKTAQGQKKIQHIIMSFQQPSPPRYIVE
ncbi:hypothetical protein Y032_0015g2754 [Ancylostoma ceylanicum]|nr:hypothetical protein Y032_0015g2754 [Ancylostoma ceylanicum]